jgi:hypothetical protein
MDQSADKYSFEVEIAYWLPFGKIFDDDQHKDLIDEIVASVSKIE